MTNAEDMNEPPISDRARRMQENMQRVDELSRRLTAALAKRRQQDPALSGPSADVYMKAATSYFAEMLQDPARIIERQSRYWGKTLQHYLEAQQQFALGDMETKTESDEGWTDRRFNHPLWYTNPFFHYLKRQYDLNSEAMMDTVRDMSSLEPEDRKQVEYFTQQIVNMLAPTNFLGMNPDALEKAIETDGGSLVEGLSNLVRDLERNEGEVVVTLADPNAFKVGENLATTPGSVVYRNHLIELIQYTPTTDKVYKVPLIIYPPWINKFYILDLNEQKSFIRWVVGQGYTVFVVSWVNPDASYAETGFDDYIRDGYLRAITEVQAITGEKKVNAVGYCIGGTGLALTLASLAQKKDTTINSATFLTTLTDFTDPGEIIVFLSGSFLDGIERQMARDGYMSKLYMQRTFSSLRSNDLVYTPAVKSYLLGETPPAFDLLFWNGDSTNLPRKMAQDYLRGLYGENKFAKAEFEVFGKKVGLDGVTVPLYAVTCEKDHIAPWKSCFDGICQMASRNKTFILAESGHIAGVVNSPGKGKYGHYTSDKPVDGDADSWLEGATLNSGTWWLHWEKWLKGFSGAMVNARQPGGPKHPVLAPAPGTYVVTKEVGEEAE